VAGWYPDEEAQELERLDLEQLSEQLRRHELALEAALEAQLEHDPATWTIPDDGYRDGGTPYSEEELAELPDKEEKDDV
jgi:hypothetical protein